jgi:hypothetical protein
MRRARAPLSRRRMQTDRPYRDERDAALARVARLERDLERARRELAGAKRALARRTKREWGRAMIGGTAALALLLALLMVLAFVFGGCVGGLEPRVEHHFRYVSPRF